MQSARPCFRSVLQISVQAASKLPLALFRGFRASCALLENNKHRIVSIGVPTTPVCPCTLIKSPRDRENQPSLPYESRGRSKQGMHDHGISTYCVLYFVNSGSGIPCLSIFRTAESLVAKIFSDIAFLYGFFQRPKRSPCFPGSLASKDSKIRSTRVGKEWDRGRGKALRN